MSLKVIQGGFKEKDKPNLFSIYLNAYIRKLNIGAESDGKVDKDTKKQLIFYGLKTIVHKSDHDKHDIEKLKIWFGLCTLVKTLISELTPRELMQIFPVTKEYDGAKWECKDYYYTMHECKKIGLDTPIGDNVDNLLWDYMNMNTRMFVVKEMQVMSDIRVSQGDKGIMEEFMEEQGVTTYTMFESEGKQFSKNNQTGKIVRAKKTMPRYLKEV